MARIDLVGLARSLLEEVGVPYTYVKSKRHPQFQWMAKGRKFQFTCAKTTSDWRAGMNCKSQLRRLLREGGLEK